MPEVDDNASTTNQRRFETILGCFEIDGPFGVWPDDAWVVSDGRFFRYRDPAWKYVSKIDELSWDIR